MARGRPALWSWILGGAIIYVGTEANGWARDAGVESPLGLDIMFILFGLFVIAVGTYIQFVAPDPLTIRDHEQLVDVRHPTQRIAIAKIGLSVPFFVLTLWLLYGLPIEYWPGILTLFVWFYIFSQGIYTYWRNTLTTYYITTRRVITEYRFISLHRRELPLSRVRGIQEDKSILETLIGIGSIRIATGGGTRTLEVTMRNIDGCTDFADLIRDLV